MSQADIVTGTMCAHTVSIVCAIVTDTVRDIRISNQFMITCALHFAQPQAYYQASVTITLGRRV